MNKQEIRPLLMEALAQAKLQEEAACKQIQREKAAGWSVAAAQLEAWRATRFKRAQAGLQLWLADRQWEREEKVNSQEALEDKLQLQAYLDASRDFKV